MEFLRYNRLCVLLLSLALLVGFVSPLLFLAPARGADTGEEFGWYIQDSGRANYLKGVSAADAENAWAVGWYDFVTDDVYIILHTDDGGETWVSQTYSSGRSLNDVYAVDQDNAWAVGEYGTIIRTSDAGANWAVQESGTTERLSSICAVDAMTAWTVGTNGTILKTIDGGSSWNPQTSGTPYHLEEISAVDANIAWAVGEGSDSSGHHDVILKTEDGGTTWNERNAASTYILLSICAVDGNNAWVGGENGDILRTSDGGATWTAQDSGFDEEWYGITAIDSNTAWACGDLGIIIKTTDGGDTWVRQQSGYIFNINDIDAVNADVVWAAGYNATILHTTNGGDPPPVVLNISSLSSSSGQVYQIIGISGTKFGANQDTSYVTFGSTPAAHYLSWSDTQIACRVPEMAAGEAPVSVHTGEGDSNEVPFTVVHPQQGWIFQDSSALAMLMGVSAVDEQTCWAVGASAGSSTTMPGALIAKTTDGGSSWVQQDPGVQTMLTCVSAVDADTCWAGGWGCILRTTDGGASWNVVIASADYIVNGICAVDENTCWAVGGTMSGTGGYIIRTVDGGANWSVPVAALSHTMLGISALDSDTCWAVGGRVTYGGIDYHGMAEGAILSTNDGGATWTGHGDIDYAYNGVEAVDTQTIWVCGTYVPRYSQITNPARSECRITTDAGANWKTVASPSMPFMPNMFMPYLGLEAFDGDTAWIVSPYGNIAKTTNAGDTWIIQNDFPLGGSLFGISAVDVDTAWTVGFHDLASMYMMLPGTGVILHTTNGGWSMPAPQISSVDPPSGLWGEEVTLSGQYFGSQTSTSSLTIAGEQATIVSWSDTQIVFRVPNSLPPGQTTVSLKTAGGIANATFEVLLTTAISGSVFNGKIHGIEGIDVNIYDSENVLVASGVTSPSGSFLMYTTLLSGAYKIEFQDPTGTYMPEWYDNQPDFESADPFGITQATFNYVPRVTLLRPPSTISSIIPNSGEIDAIVDVTITGSGFEPGASVMLKGENSVVVFGREETVVSPTEMTCQLPLWVNQTGVFDVIVSVPDRAPGVLEGGFTVTGTNPPMIYQVEPYEVAQYTFYANIALEGTAFQPGASVRLEKGEIVLYPDSVNVVSESHIDCVFNLFWAEPGTYTVVVKNPDGKEAYAYDNFTIKPSCGAGGGSALLLLGLALGLLSLAGSQGIHKRRRRRKISGSER